MKTLILAALVVAAPLPPMVKMALNEATLHLNAGQFTAAERVLKDLKQRLWLVGTADADTVKVKVEFVLWDLRMGLHEQAKQDLKALAEHVATIR
jgi:hypothetical protein